jgi:thiol-disulfide isomerase/thioredoxin
MTLLDQPLIRMPEFGSGQWLNTARPLNRSILRGRVVLVDFWDYTCLNCLRTLPYVKAWYGRYAELGLAIIGVHAPEFTFARQQGQIEEALDRLAIRYPVLLDNEYQTWDRFANKAWPGKYLIDSAGYIRLQRHGEGYYRLFEEAIQALLRQRDPAVTLPDLLPPLRPEDRPGAVCYRPSPELYAGYKGGGIFSGALGNPEGYVTGSVMGYQMPGPFDRPAGRFYLAGFWRSLPDAVVFAGRTGGLVALPYQAAGVNAVLSPTADPVELMLHLPFDQAPALVEVRQDGQPLAATNAGADITFDDSGRSFILVNQPRLYELVRNPTREEHELELVINSSGLALYSFTFSTCIIPGGGEPESGAFQVK